MQTSEAPRIIHTLADGVNPVSGEVLAQDSAYQQPHLMRALYACIRALKRQEQRERRGFQLPANAGKPWNEGEDQLLKERFDQGTPIKEIAREQARSQRRWRGGRRSHLCSGATQRRGSPRYGESSWGRRHAAGEPIPRASLKGNPRLSTLAAILKAAKLKLTVAA